MGIWRFSTEVSGSLTVEIHADTEAEARELLAAGEYETGGSLCIHCDGAAGRLNEFPIRFDMDLDQPDELKFSKFEEDGQ
jgi:hypothetical protein